MHFEDPKAFIENSSDIKDVYKNICGYNLRKKCKILIASEHTLRFRIIGGAGIVGGFETSTNN